MLQYDLMSISNGKKNILRQNYKTKTNLLYFYSYVVMKLAFQHFYCL